MKQPQTPTRAREIWDYIWGLNIPVDPQYSVQDLKAIERERRLVLKTSDEVRPWKLAGSGFVATLLDPLFVFSMVVYVVFRVFHYLDLDRTFEDFLPSWHEFLRPVVLFLTFFQSIMFAESYRRFFDQYKLSMACEGRIFDVASLASATLSATAARRLVRYLNASHVALYVGMCPSYNYSNLFQHVNQTWGLLTKRECARMRQIDMDQTGGSACRELITWGLREVESAHQRGDIDDHLSKQMREQILQLRGAMGSLFDYDDQPLPYFFFYFVYILSLLYLPQAAISIGSEVKEETVGFEILAFLIKMTNIFFIVGVRVLSRKMAKPYGDDIEDLSVMHYVNFTCQASFRVLAAEIPAPTTDEEEELALTAYLGEAWKMAGTSSTTARDSEPSYSRKKPLLPELAQSADIV